MASGNPFTALLRQHAVNREPVEGEYLHDGLICCEACRTPRQCRVMVCGQEFVVPALCRCQEEQFKAQTEALERQRRAAHINSLRKSGMHDKKYYEWTFEHSDSEITFARRYVEHWEEFKRDNVGLMILGDTGTGKSFAAGCIANALIGRGESVYMANVIDITNRMTSLYDSERLAYIESLQRYALLIVDDFGAERGSDFTQEQIYNLVETRYRSGKPLIITSNLTLDQLRQCTELKYARAYDRLKEMCHPVQMLGESRRKGIANSRFKGMEALLK